MSILDRDLIMRQIRFLQQLLARAMGRAAQQDFFGALAELRSGYQQAVGVPHDLISRLDVGSALLMLSSRERRSAYLDLLRAESQILRAQGDTGAHNDLDRRIAEVEAALAG